MMQFTGFGADPRAVTFAVAKELGGGPGILVGDHARSENRMPGKVLVRLVTGACLASIQCSLCVTRLIEHLGSRALQKIILGRFCVGRINVSNGT